MGGRVLKGFGGSEYRSEEREEKALFAGRTLTADGSWDRLFPIPASWSSAHVPAHFFLPFLLLETGKRIRRARLDPTLEMRFEPAAGDAQLAVTIWL